MIDLDDLRRKAEAATPGPWLLHHQRPDMMAGDCDWSLQTDAAGAFLLFCHHPDAPARANSEYLVAAQPKHVLALIATNKALVEALDELLAAHREWEGHPGDDERVRVATSRAIAALASTKEPKP